MVDSSFMDAKHTSTLKVVMIPWLAHGHISPYLELAKKLSKKNFSVYFCSTPINLSSIKERVAENDSGSNSIQLVEFHLPSLPALPPNLHTTKGLPRHLTTTLVKAFEMASPSVSTILETINPNLVIFDINQPWVLSLASSRNIPAVHFQILGAAALSFVYRLYKHQGVTYPFKEIFLREFEIKKMMSIPVLGNTTSGFSDADRAFMGIQNTCDILLIKSSREIEGKYSDFLSGLIKKKIVLTGPLVQDINEEEHHSKIFERLSKTEKSSCVFVSFGSECYLSKNEMEELAHGLELSNVDFIWVIRFPVGEEITLEEALPEGFLERVKERSTIVEGWAPQAKILRHPSIGGFVSHCGWSSVIESISFGVPIIAMPMQFEQPMNARLVVDVGVGLEVIRDENGELKREEVAKVIKEVVEKEKGEEIRRKAKELSENLRVKGDEEGDISVEELVKLCVKNKPQ